MSEDCIRRTEELVSGIAELREGKGQRESNLRVKFVPRLGPFMTLNASKKATAAAVEWNVTENKPP
jgi:hypothetical protein